MNMPYEDLERRLYCDGRLAELEVLNLGVEVGQESRSAEDARELDRLQDELHEAEQERNDAEKDAELAAAVLVQLHLAFQDRKALWRLLRNAEEVSRLIYTLRQWPGTTDARHGRARLTAIIEGTTK